MKLTINQRLKHWLDYKEISQVNFGENFGRSRGQINNWCSGSAPIPDKYIIKTVELFPDLNARWFITGEGEMLTREAAAPSKSKSYQTNNTEVDMANDDGYCCKRCKDKDKLIENMEARLKDKEVIIELLTKKEAGAANSTQLGEGAKQNKAS